MHHSKSTQGSVFLTRAVIVVVLTLLAFFAGRISKTKRSQNQQGNTAVNLSSKTSSIDRNSFATAGRKSSRYRLNPSEAKTGNALESKALLEKLLEWAKDDPEGALAYAQNEIHPWHESQKIIFAILQQWGSEEPELAWSWTEENESRHLVDLISDIARVDAKLGWEKANLYVAAGNEHLARESFLQAIEGAVVEGEYEGTLELLLASKVPKTRDTRHGKFSFVEDILVEWYRFAPEEAFKWMESLPGDHYEPLKALANRAAIQLMSPVNPERAAEYSLTLPKEHLGRMYGLGTSLDHWVRTDLVGATEWLNEQGHTEEFDPIVFELVSMPEMSMENPEVTADWAQSIIDPDRRSEALAFLAADWMQNDEEAARHYFEQNQLLDEAGWQRVESIVEERLKGDYPRTPEDEQFFRED